MKKKTRNVLFVIGLILLAVFMTNTGTVFNNVSYAGLDFTNEEFDFDINCNLGYSSLAQVQGEFLILKASASENQVVRRISADVSGVDEFLVIYEGYAVAGCTNGQPGSSAGFSGGVEGDSGVLDVGKSAGCSYGVSEGTKTFPPSLWKFKNNFDGTWSNLESLGVGDIFIEKGRKTIGNNPRLYFQAAAGNGCGKHGSGSTQLKIYNIVKKENSFAVCKADEFLSDGKCTQLSQIILASEEAIKESTDEKIARITAELEAKNAGLQENINFLNEVLKTQPTSSDLAKIHTDMAALQAELKTTKDTLAAVQAGDNNVIAVIESQEQFQQPSSFQSFINRIVAFIKSIFK